MQLEAVPSGLITVYMGEEIDHNPLWVIVESVYWPFGSSVDQIVFLVHLSTVFPMFAVQLEHAHQWMHTHVGGCVVIPLLVKRFALKIR